MSVVRVILPLISHLHGIVATVARRASDKKVSKVARYSSDGVDERYDQLCIGSDPPSSEAHDTSLA